MRYAIVSSCVLAVGGAVCLADDNEVRQQPTGSTQSSAIDVKFSGRLTTSTVSKPGAAGPEELSSAEVHAAGTVVHLDWSRSQKIRDELLWWSVPRAGDIRLPYAEVSGRMQFKPLRELDRAVLTPQRGVSADTPVPVVVVESIKVYLAGPDGRPRGSQPGRGLVQAEEATH